MIEISAKRQHGNFTTIVCEMSPTEIVEEIAVKASVVSIIHTAILGIIQFVGINLEVQDEDDKIYFTLPEGLPETLQHDIDIIIGTMMCGLSDLWVTFSDFFNLEVYQS